MTLPAGPYSLILADPPWSYDDGRTHASAGMARSSYRCPPLEELMALPVGALAANPTALCMWWTGPKAGEARALAEAWGFRVVTMKLFTWVKLRPGFPWFTDDGYGPVGIVQRDIYSGLGHWTNANTEDVLLAWNTRKRLARADRTVKQVVLEPRRGHSAKPVEVRRRLERLFGDVPRVELFARDRAPGWDAWGDELAS